MRKFGMPLIGVTAGSAVALVTGAAAAQPSSQTPNQNEPQNEQQNKDRNEQQNRDQYKEQGAGTEKGRQCPDLMRGVNMTTVNVPKGIAMQFTTDPNRVDKLRTQVGQLAQLVADYSHASSAEAQIPPLDISTSNIDGGLRVVVRSERTQHVSQLRQKATALERAWEETCGKGAHQRG